MYTFCCLNNIVSRAKISLGGNLSNDLKVIDDRSGNRIKESWCKSHLKYSLEQVIFHHCILMREDYCDMRSFSHFLDSGSSYPTVTCCNSCSHITILNKPLNFLIKLHKILIYNVTHVVEYPFSLFSNTLILTIVNTNWSSYIAIKLPTYSEVC